MLRVTPGVCAWAVVTGVAMVKSGLGIQAVVLMSVLVFAASAQLAALPLMLAGAPIGLIWLAAACVNLRFVVFSAEMRRYMVKLPWAGRLLGGYLTADMTFALMHHRFHAVPDHALDVRAATAYFAGLTTVNWTSWNVASLVGIALADQIPMSWGLDLAGALALLGLAATLMNDWRKVCVGVFAAGTSLATLDWPFKSGIVLAICGSIVLGYLFERGRSQGGESKEDQT